MTLIRTLLLAGASLSFASAAEARQLTFSGRTWDVKTSSGGLVGPGPNIFTDASSAIYVDASGALHLTITRKQGKWLSTEIVGLQSLGYGTYRFDIAPGATKIADNAVFGMFTYDLLPAENYREVDIELSKWGDGRINNLQCSVQPADAPDLYKQMAVAENLKGWTMEFSWSPGNFGCKVTDQSTGSIVGTGQVTRGVPTPGNEKTRLNLWQFRGQAPIGNVASEVIVRSFTFVPM